MDTNTNDNKYFLPGAVILAGLFIAGAVIWSNGHPSANTGTQGGTPSAVNVDIHNVNLEGDPYIGQADAPVTIAFWSDFQCPYCKAFEIGGIPQISTPPAFPDILKNYVQTGKVKVVFLDFVFLGQDSVTASLYSHSIWKLYPDQYFAWRTAMYTAQDDEGDQGFGDAASIDALNATIPGLDANAISADVTANATTYQAEVDADRKEADKAGITATPSFVIGTQLIAGAYPYATFESAIDALLK